MSDIDEGSLKKGDLRKLKALRKSLGSPIADKAFAAWFESNARTDETPEDRSAAVILEALTAPVMEGRIKIPRGGYLIRRGHGRIIVEPAKGQRDDS